MSLSVANAEPGVSINLKKPPASLAKWYKPDNKRQVWLHTMFKLRREMQAMREYAEQEDGLHMEKWLTDFDKHYNKISEMVPEWKDEIKPELISDIRNFVKSKDFYKVAITLNKIEDTCDVCHENYQPQVTAIYRSPNYDSLRIKDVDGELQTIENNMQDLSVVVNQILIALADGNNKKSFIASNDLELQLKNLADSCQFCHKNDKYPEARILGKETTGNLKKLQKNIQQGHTKASQKLMGKIAVTVCARCHSIHKVVHDMRGALMSENDDVIKLE